ncbi:39S ribosomal protein L39, mitochondrial, partial [Orchesella cincta]
ENSSSEALITKLTMSSSDTEMEVKSEPIPETTISVKDEELDLDPPEDSIIKKETKVETSKGSGEIDLTGNDDVDDLTCGVGVYKDALKKFAANPDDDVTVYHVTEKCKKVSCYVGIDEAGRGPVLGPMVYSIFACVADEESINEKKKKGQSLSKIEDCPPVLLDKLAKLNDSKQLTEKVREEIFQKFSDMDHIAFGLKIISPSQIANKSYRRQKYSLNEISHNAAIELIQGFADRGIKIERVYVDTVGPMDKYQKKLEVTFPDLRFKVDKKADAKYKPVSAASVCAKVTRDVALKKWKFPESENLGSSSGWGSGYPGDPVTKRFLRKNIDPVFGFPNIVRNSWSTASELLEKCAVKIKWESDEQDEVVAPKISKYFGKKSAGDENVDENVSEMSRRKSQFFSYRDLYQTTFVLDEVSKFLLLYSFFMTSNKLIISFLRNLEYSENVEVVVHKSVSPKHRAAAESRLKSKSTIVWFLGRFMSLPLTNLKDSIMGRLSGLIGKCRYSGLIHIQKRYFQMHSIQGPTPEEIEGVRKDLFGKLSRENIRSILQHPIPSVNNPVVRAKRSKMFSEEKDNQYKELGRIEKIDVEYVGVPENVTLMMNKGISTPYDCAKHMSEMHLQRSVVAEVNGQLWDMHRPMGESCKLRLLHMKMKEEDPFNINKIFWRSCSFMLGAVAESTFHDHIYVELHSFPSANVRSGSFVYDVDLKIKDWKPNSDEMRVFSLEMRKLAQKNLPFERLEVNVDLALEMFEDNQYKKKQIPEIAANSATGKTVCLYRIGDFVDISRGPLMSTTGLLGRCTITALHPLRELTNVSDTLYRMQGVALPAGFLLNYFAYGLIEQRGRLLNSARIPGSLQPHKHISAKHSPNQKTPLIEDEQKQAVAV